jgi:hypothetical protein
MSDSASAKVDPSASEIFRIRHNMAIRVERALRESRSRRDLIARLLDEGVRIEPRGTKSIDTISVAYVAMDSGIEVSATSLGNRFTWSRLYPLPAMEAEVAILIAGLPDKDKVRRHFARIAATFGHERYARFLAKIRDSVDAKVFKAASAIGPAANGSGPNSPEAKAKLAAVLKPYSGDFRKAFRVFLKSGQFPENPGWMPIFRRLKADLK